ncbi:hypothetical protein [Natronolimnohabitans innermongolicus]|uniref:Uncharacterized protein n=1 Tax=Natronolimnohabitans innermongolicus JCM 12255 TaxID=1227499 RepID=L9X8E2_9EURY|nr:hypothetical protein [Natronolimnohabitans innermongolicus]ELY57711.1 hypothetical protein C493_07464 [Natronolimnohabitans innermongolicus JCM 12255]
MAECNRCGDENGRLFEHRVRTEAMTHRRTERVCAACHPDVPAVLETPSESATEGERLVTDGG